MRRLLLLATLTLAGCARNQPVLGVKVDPALAMLVPADTTLLAGTRLEALRQTPVYQRYLADRSFPQVEELARQTGLDPRKDLWELLFVSNGRQGILLGRGRFPDETEKQGTQGFVYKGLKIIGDDRTAVLFINSSTAAVGETAALRSLADQREKSNGPPAPLAALMKEVPADVQVWAAYTGTSFGLAFPGNLANATKILGSVQSGSVYFDLRTGLKGVAAATCTTEQDAREVHDALKALAGLGQLSAPQAFESIRVTLDARRVKLDIDAPEEAVDQLLGLWLGRKR